MAKTTIVNRQFPSSKTSPSPKDDSSPKFTSSSIMYKPMKIENGKMSFEQTACEDLKAFERRLTEVIACHQPTALRWRIALLVISLVTAIGAWYWLTDPYTADVSFTQSLLNHPFFATSSLILLLLFTVGIHRKVIAPSIITARARLVLNDFNMSCDDLGNLILKPRPPHALPPHES